MTDLKLYGSVTANTCKIFLSSLMFGFFTRVLANTLYVSPCRNTLYVIPCSLTPALIDWIQLESISLFFTLLSLYAYWAALFTLHRASPKQDLERPSIPDLSYNLLSIPISHLI